MGNPPRFSDFRFEAWLSQGTAQHFTVVGPAVGCDGTRPWPTCPAFRTTEVRPTRHLGPHSAPDLLPYLPFDPERFDPTAIADPRSDGKAAFIGTILPVACPVLRPGLDVNKSSRLWFGRGCRFDHDHYLSFRGRGRSGRRDCLEQLAGAPLAHEAPDDAADARSQPQGA